MGKGGVRLQQSFGYGGWHHGFSCHVPEIIAHLYAKYGIFKSEKKFTESLIKPM